MLRDYQQTLLENIFKSFDYGARAVCAQMPTGAGKSVVMRKIVAGHKGYSCVIAHRSELVSQMSRHLALEKVAHNIIAPTSLINTIIKEQKEEFGRHFYSPNSIASVASTQTLMARSKHIAPLANRVSLLLHDECHHLLRDNMFGKSVDLFPKAKLVGFTATPERTDKFGIARLADGYFDAMVTGPSMRDLIDAGHLCDYKLLVPPGDFDISHLKVGSSGEYTPQSLRDESRKSKLVGNIFETWKRYASGMQTIIFATDIETSNEIAAQFGDIAQSVSSKTPEYDRFKAIKAFREGRLRVLVNVDLFGEGFDVPGVECVVMARPTKSLGLYLQMVGRALRLMEGKDHALIVDHVSNVAEHKLPDIRREWTMERKKAARNGNGAVPLSTCTECAMQYERFKLICPYCGHEKELKQKSSSIESVEGDLMMLDKDALAALRMKVILEDPVKMAHRVGHAAGPYAAKRIERLQAEKIKVQSDLKATIERWGVNGRKTGRSDRELYREFYNTFNIDVLSSLSQDKENMMKLMERINEKS